MLQIRDATRTDLHIDAKLLEQIVESPSQYTLLLEEWNEASERLTAGLSELFQGEFSSNVFFANAFHQLADRIFRWYAGLPRAARESSMVTDTARVLRRCAKIAGLNPRTVLLQELPRLLGATNTSLNRNR